MKKILSLGVASAVLSLTAVAASATIYADVSTPVVPGEQVVVDIVADGIDTKGLEFKVEADGLTFVESANGAAGMANYADATNKAYWFSTDGTTPADGTVLLTLTYTVDAEAGEDISVTLSADEAFAKYVNATPVTVEVTAAGGEVEQPGDEPGETEEPTIEDPTEEPGEPNEVPGEEPGSEEPENPITGVGLAVIPALVAGAAVVASKKRG